MSRLTVLVTSAGRRVALLKCFRASAAKLQLDVRLLAADMCPGLAAACAFADEAIKLPPCMAADFDAALRDVCGSRGVDVVVPTIDPELPVLAALAGSLGRTRVWVSQPRAVGLVRDKLAVARALSEAKVAVPRTAMARDVLAERDGWPWPLFAKPLEGSSSAGASAVRSPEELRLRAAETPALVVQEVCRGDEYTVNMYLDGSGVLRAAVPHRRIETRGGEVNKGMTWRDLRLRDVAERLVRAVPGLRGPVCFQAFLEGAADAVPRVTDVNARFGGGYPLAHAAGAEFTTWLLEEALGRTPDWNDGFKDRLLMLRHEEAIFREG